MINEIENPAEGEGDMGYEIHYSGEISVIPPLNAAEVAFLSDFAGSRRVERLSGPYRCDGGPRPEPADPDILDRNTPPSGQPGLFCGWTPRSDGAALQAPKVGDYFNPAEWLTYLIETFLSPSCSLKHELQNPVPGRVYPQEFSHFTFDHVLNGEVVAEAPELGVREILRVTDNVASRGSA
ncbi:hypothetical protein ACH4ZU_14110 [Streptomyces sp. NPDC020472]|uniref:hypothetical protein n=1 Tax=Streptomyces sp. NPDC020472 TaxID=3365075 RepID=UPI003787C32B